MPRFAKGTKLGLRLQLELINDPYVREMFKEIQDYVNQQDILRGVWRKATYNFPAAGTYTFKHNLPFVPCDFLFTGSFGGITATIDNDTVTEEEFTITVDGPGSVRMLIGNVTDFDKR